MLSINDQGLFHVFLRRALGQLAEQILHVFQLDAHPDADRTRAAHLVLLLHVDRAEEVVEALLQVFHGQFAQVVGSAIVIFTKF